MEEDTHFLFFLLWGVKGHTHAIWTSHEKITGASVPSSRVTVHVDLGDVYSQPLNLVSHLHNHVVVDWPHVAEPKHVPHTIRAEVVNLAPGV